MLKNIQSKNTLNVFFEITNITNNKMHIFIIQLLLKIYQYANIFKMVKKALQNMAKYYTIIAL